MDIAARARVLREGKPLNFPPKSDTLEYAQSLDAEDELKHLKDQFILPTKHSLRKTSLDGKPIGKITSRVNQRARGMGIYWVVLT